MVFVLVSPGFVSLSSVKCLNIKMSNKKRNGLNLVCKKSQPQKNPNLKPIEKQALSPNTSAQPH